MTKESGNQASKIFMKPLYDSPTVRKIASFDIETYGKQNKFLMGSVGYYDLGNNRYGKEKEIVKVFWDKQKMIDYIVKNPKFYRNYNIFATNLQFDLLALFENTEEYDNLKLIFRGSRLLAGKYYNETIKEGNNHKYIISFYDSLNHVRTSVAKLGELINIPKYEKPAFLGKIPRDKEERKILEDYNIRDTIITLRFMKYWQQQLNKIGCSLKITLPSSSMDLFKRKYLNERIAQPKKPILEKLYNGYYGGRTETIKRGKIKNAKLYDINSLYPYVMAFNKYPNPSNVYYSKDQENDYNIQKYEGISLVEMYCPEKIHLPYLPVRYNNKLIFPAGHIKGWFTHYEIREAQKLGYELLKIHESITYPKTHKPFTDFVTDLYNERMKNIKNRPIQMTYKLLMNSLYGKFGQKIEPEPEIRTMQSMNKEYFIKLWNNPETKVRVVNGHVFYNYTKPKHISSYINPIYSIYVTAYARDFLYKTLPDDVYYMDTDSCITKQNLETGGMLGEWKKELDIDSGIIIKPKFYVVNDRAKVKGCSKIDYDKTIDILLGKYYSEKRKCWVAKPYEFEKIIKFKEALARGLSFNEIVNTQKEMGLEDDKRIWNKKFNMDELQKSKPLIMTPQHYN